MIPSSARELGGRNRRPSALAVRFARAFFSARTRVDVYEQLATLADSGMREPEAVTFLWRLRTREGRRDRFHPISLFCADAAFALAQEGRTLTEATLRWAGEFERPLLVAAVAHGGDAAAYREIVRLMQTHLVLRRSLLTLAANVGVLAGICAAAGGFLGFHFFPALQEFVAREQLYGSARALFDTAAAIRSWWPLMLGGVVLATSGVIAALPRLTGPVRDAVDSLEPFATYRHLTGGMFLIGAAALLRTGMNERRALALLRRHASPYLANHIRRLERVDASLGNRIRQSPEDWPDRRAKLEVAVAAEGDDPIAGYAKAGADLIERTTRSCERLSRLSGWASSFVLAGVVVWILVATNEINAAFQAARRGL